MSFAHFMIQNNIPFNVLNSASFKSFWVTHLDAEKAPSSRFVSKAALTDLYSTCIKVISKELGEQTALAMTTDGWTGKRSSIWSVNVSFVTSAWELKHRKLGCIPVIGEVHSAPVVASHIRELLSLFENAHLKLASVTTDEGGCAPLIANEFGTDEIHCALHLLNTVLKHSFEDLLQRFPLASIILAACRLMASHFNHSTQASEQLLVNQLHSGDPLTTIKQSVPTRFNSNLRMLKSVDASTNSILAYCAANMDAPFSDAILRNIDSFTRLLPKLVSILELFQTATMEFEKQSATLDQLINLYFWLKKRLDALVFNDEIVGIDGTDAVMEICRSLVTSLLRYMAIKFNPFTTAELLAFSLNPTHRKRPAVAANIEWNETVSDAQAALRQVFEAELAKVAPPTAAAQPPQNRSIFYDDDAFVIPLAENPQEELERFFSEPPTRLSALEWWKQNAGRYPILAPLARRYLCMCPSQAASERDFSLLRLILTHLRHNMSHQTLHQLSVVQPLLSDLYRVPPRPRSAANIAADASRGQSAKRKRRESMQQEYAVLRPNPAVRPEEVPDILHELDPVVDDAVDVDDGERSSDDDFMDDDDDINSDDDDEDFPAAVLAVAPVEPVPAAVPARYRPTCELFQPVMGQHQYVARFKGLRHPVPPVAGLFGQNAGFIKDFTKIEKDHDTHYLVCVTDAAKKKHPGSRALMRQLGEIIQLLPSMYDVPPTNWPQ